MIFGWALPRRLTITFHNSTCPAEPKYVAVVCGNGERAHIRPGKKAKKLIREGTIESILKGHLTCDCGCLPKWFQSLGVNHKEYKPDPTRFEHGEKVSGKGKVEGRDLHQVKRAWSSPSRLGKLTYP